MGVYQPTLHYIQDDSNSLPVLPQVTVRERHDIRCTVCHFPLTSITFGVFSLVPDIPTSCEMATEGGRCKYQSTGSWEETKVVQTYLQNEMF